MSAARRGTSSPSGSGPTCCSWFRSRSSILPVQSPDIDGGSRVRRATGAVDRIGIPSMHHRGGVASVHAAPPQV